MRDNLITFFATCWVGVTIIAAMNWVVCVFKNRNFFEIGWFLCCEPWKLIVRIESSSN